MSTEEKEVTGQNDLSSQDSITQQTNIQENQPTSIDVRDYVASLESRIAEQQIQNRRLESLIEGIREDRTRDQSPPTPRNVEEERNKFYTDPIGTLDHRLNERDNKILNEMKKMLEPLQEVASGFRFSNEYDRMKSIMKNDPVFGKALKDPDVEALVDSVMKNPGIEINENTMKAAIAQAMGMKAMGGISSSRRLDNNNNNNNNNRFDPPTIPTSRHRIEGNRTENRQLTENDRMAMKYAGLKPGNPEDEKQYWSLIENETMVLDVHKKKG